MNSKIINSFAFVLGREQKLALEELKAVLARFGFCFDIYKITANVVFANIDDFTENDAKKIIESLAGTIKVFRIVGPVKKDLSGQVADLITLLRGSAESKINFGVSYYGQGFTRQNINSIAIKAKKALKGQLSLRFVESRESNELSSIVTLKNSLVNPGMEFGLFEKEIGVLVALNNPEEWNKRDYGKPASDKFSGMVPPKLARMMLNITLAESRIKNLESSKQQPNSKFQIPNSGQPLVVLDPFCGSGNILMEAMMLGCDVIGSDISQKAVDDTRKNIDWLKSEFLVSNAKQNDQMPKSKIFQADATCEELIRNLELEIRNYNSYAVVCEPFLGQPKKFKPTHNAAFGEYRKVQELYLGFLKNIAQTKNKPLLICLVFPLVETSDKGRYSVFSGCVDELKNLGYTQIRPSFVYGRDYQVVKRELVFLKLGR